MLTVKRRPIKCSNKEASCLYVVISYCLKCFLLSKCSGSLYLQGVCRYTIMNHFLYVFAHMIASRDPLHTNASVRYTEIITTDNVSSTLCKQVFFPPTGLAHYHTQYNIVATQTTILNLSVMPVHSPPYTLPFYKSLCPSLVCHISYHAKDEIVKTVFAHCPTRYIFISQLPILVCSLFLLCSPNPFFFPHRHTSKRKSFPNCYCLPL